MAGRMYCAKLVVGLTESAIVMNVQEASRSGKHSPSKIINYDHPLTIIIL